uniref:Putative secreted peptide n=1 Tax=Anopheles braziliensis TaxID=58242 RepID=A0A2M3ZS97_9DIPT
MPLLMAVMVVMVMVMMMMLAMALVTSLGCRPMLVIMLHLVPILRQRHSIRPQLPLLRCARRRDRIIGHAYV